MDLERMQALLTALQEARFAGLRSVSYDGKTVTYGSDAELAAAMHSDMSGALDQKGIAVTLIHAGDRKVDANPYQPLPEAVRARIAGELEDLRQLFAETVAKGRGRRPDRPRRQRR